MFNHFHSQSETAALKIVLIDQSKLGIFVTCQIQQSAKDCSFAISTDAHSLGTQRATTNLLNFLRRVDTNEAVFH